MWFAVVFAVLSAVQQMNQASAQKAAAKRQEAAAEEARDIARQNAAAEEAETQETLRRQGKQDLAEEAAARAAAAASGFALDEEKTPGSIALSLAAQKTENKNQMDYAVTAGKSRADILRRQGEHAYTIGMNRAEEQRSAARASKWGAVLSLGKAGASAYGASTGGTQSPAPVEDRSYGYWR